MLHEYAGRLREAVQGYEKLLKDPDFPDSLKLQIRFTLPRIRPKA